MPSGLIPEVLFSCEQCCFDGFGVSGDDVACFL